MSKMSTKTSLFLIQSFIFLGLNNCLIFITLTVFLLCSVSPCDPSPFLLRLSGLGTVYAAYSHTGHSRWIVCGFPISSEVVDTWKR